MKKKTNKVRLRRSVVSVLNATNVNGGYRRATQSNQAPTGCNTNCKSDDCPTVQKQ